MADLNMHLINRPLLLVAMAQEKFNVNIKLADEESRETLRNLMTGQVEWTQRLQASR